MPIGEDRYFNVYWIFSGDEDRLYVQRRVSPCHEKSKKNLRVSIEKIRSDEELSEEARAAKLRKCLSTHFSLLNTAAGAQQPNTGSTPAGSVPGSANRAPTPQATATSSSNSTEGGAVTAAAAALPRLPVPPYVLDVLSADASAALLYFTRPLGVQFEWGVYDTPQALWLLWDSLDARGER